MIVTKRGASGITLVRVNTFMGPPAVRLKPLPGFEGETYGKSSPVPLRIWRKRLGVKIFIHPSR